MGQRERYITWAWLALAGLSLPGCMSAVPSDEIEGESVEVSRLAGVTPPPGAIAAAREEAETSVIITELLGRESVLPAGSAFARVSDAVLKADARASASELKAARLRAQAASKNWLPRVGPVVSLASLSDVVTQLAADVELAAITLSEDTNARVLTALSLYLDGAQARERVALERRTLKDMERFEYIMQERVRGGVSDRSDLGILRQKLAEIRARLAAAEEAGATARAELNAMSAVPLDDVTGLADVRVGGFDARPLDILRAEATRDRDIAQARVDRAGLLPGVNAGGTLGSGGTGVTVNAGQDSLWGVGTGASLKAIKAVEEASSRRVAQASEDATRQISRLESRLKALGRQVAEASQLTQEAKRNLDLFQGQYDAGQRQVMDVVGVYETFAEQQSRQVGLKYELALARLQLARVMGVLADGGRI